MKYRVLIPVDQQPLAPEDIEPINAAPTKEDGTPVPSIVVSAGYLGRCKSFILDEREVGNWFTMFKNDPNMGSRFYVERIYEERDDYEQAAELAALRRKLSQ
jgi:hypothetical protein